MKFKIQSTQKDNSHPAIKIALRKWLLKFFKNPSILDVYGGGGLMFKRVWNGATSKYQKTSGDPILWLESQKTLSHDIYDVDPYASPYEALFIIGQKSTKRKIGVVCTDGSLRRCALMRTKIPEFLQEKCKWPQRDLNLLAAIYYQYPSYLRFVLKTTTEMEIKNLAIKYGIGTWKQATCYYAAILER